MPKLDFSPRLHGFHFRNAFVHFDGDVFGHRVRLAGLCGGMSLAAFNYYRHGYPVPTHRAEDFGTADGVPPAGSRLHGYLLAQQIGSFASALGFFFPTPDWVSDPDELRMQYEASLGDFERIRRAIDAKKFVLLGLRSSKRGNLIGHQTLAYGYDVSPPRVHVYDPNYPDTEITLVADPGTQRVVHQHADGTGTADASEYAGFFVQLELDPRATDVFTEPSRPTYRDIGLCHGIALSEPVGNGRRQPGEPLELDVVVRNFGDHPARVNDLVLWVRDPANVPRDDELGTRTGPRVLQPGEEVRLRRRVERFGDRTGRYSLGIDYVGGTGHWFRVPALKPGTGHNRTVELTDPVPPGSEYGTGGYRGPGIYVIRAKHSGKVLDVNIDWFSGQNDGRPLAQVGINGGDHQKFRVEPLPGGYVRLTPCHSGKALEVARASLDPGTELVQWSWNGGPHQQFRIEPVGNCYRIRVRRSELCLDVRGGSRDDAAPIIQWPFHGGDNQLFEFVAA